MENENLKPVQTIPPFTKMIMTIGALPTSFYSSMSYYEAMVWLYEYLKNTIIPTVNNNGEAVEELQTAFIELKEWTETYTEETIPEEVNRKLDEMAEDGTLEALLDEIMKYKGLQSYNTVNEMKTSTNLVNGTTVRTLGYHLINDMGGAYYKIRELEESDTIDEILLISLIEENLVAELIIKNAMNVECFGTYGDNNHDDSNAIKKALENCKSVEFNNKTYMCNISINASGLEIIGNNATLKANNESSSPILQFLGTEENQINNLKITNINLDGNKNNITPNNVCQGISLIYVNNSIINNINIHDVYRSFIALDRSNNISIINYKGFNGGISTEESGCVMLESYNSKYINCDNIEFNNFFGEGFLLINSKNINVNNFISKTATRSGNNAFTTEDCENINLNNFEIDTTNHQGIEINSTNNFFITNGNVKNCYRNGIMLSTYSRNSYKPSSNGVLRNIILSDNMSGSITDTFDIYIIGNKNIDLQNINALKIKLSKDSGNNFPINQIKIEQSIINFLSLAGIGDKGLINVNLINNSITTISKDAFAMYNLIDNKIVIYHEDFKIANNETKNITIPVPQNMMITGLIKYISGFAPAFNQQYSNRIIAFSNMGATDTLEQSVLFQKDGSVAARNITIAHSSNNVITLSNATGVELTVSFTIEATVFYS